MGEKKNKTQQPLPLCDCLISSLPRNKYWNLYRFFLWYMTYLTIKKIVTNAAKWTTIVPIPMLEWCSNWFPYRKLEAKSIKFLSGDPPPSPQTRSPSTPCLCECCNHIASDLVWPLRNIPDLSSPLSPDPVGRACSAIFLLALSTMSLSLLPRWPTSYPSSPVFAHPVLWSPRESDPLILLLQMP